MRLSESQALLLRELEIPLWNACDAATLPAAARLLRSPASVPEAPVRTLEASAGPECAAIDAAATAERVESRDAVRAQLSELRASLAKPVDRVRSARRTASVSVDQPADQLVDRPVDEPAERPVVSLAKGPLDEPRASVAAPMSAMPAAPEPGGSPWARLQDEVRTCRRCPALCDSRRQTVFGGGSERPDWLFVGEAPGAEEDRRGEPFVGPAGQLLDRMLAALRLDRNHAVYITNVLKCRPPGNRDPAPEEVAACGDYLDRQIDTLRPRVLVALGRHAAGRLTGQPEAKLGALRGRVHAYRGIPLVVTYHPAYLLRATEHKARAWVDLQLAARTLRDAVE